MTTVLTENLQLMSINSFLYKEGNKGLEFVRDVHVKEQNCVVGAEVRYRIKE